MKTVELFVTESGKILQTPDDGFIIHGTLFKGDNQGGLIGDKETVEASKNIPGRAFTNFELLDALCLDISVFEQYVRFRTPQTRGFAGITKS